MSTPIKIVPHIFMKDYQTELHGITLEMPLFATFINASFFVRAVIDTPAAWALQHG